MTMCFLGLVLGHVQTQLLLELCMRFFVLFCFPFDWRSLDTTGVHPGVGGDSSLTHQVLSSNICQINE